MKLENKICIVTGASSGMGRAIAILFAENGATVIAAARRLSRLEELAAQNSNIKPAAVDVSDKRQVMALVQDTIKQYGKLDVLVNNAGILDNFAPITGLSDEVWENVMNVNVNSVMYATREALPTMIKQGGGIIINVSSIGGLQGSRAGLAYTASKHAVNGITKNVAFQYGPQNIRCNAICPGGVHTEITNDMENASKFGLERAMAGNGANIKTANAEEIATVALFLACDDSSFVNGATLVADGGLIAY